MDQWHKWIKWINEHWKVKKSILWTALRIGAQLDPNGLAVDKHGSAQQNKSEQSLNLIRFDPTNDDHQHWRFVQTIHGLAYLHWRGVGASADVPCRCQNRFESVEIQSIACRTLMNMALSNRMSHWDSLDARQAGSLYSPGDPS